MFDCKHRLVLCLSFFFGSRQERIRSRCRSRDVHPTRKLSCRGRLVWGLCCVIWIVTVGCGKSEKTSDSLIDPASSQSIEAVDQQIGSNAVTARTTNTEQDTEQDVDETVTAPPSLPVLRIPGRVAQVSEELLPTGPKTFPEHITLAFSKLIVPSNSLEEWEQAQQNFVQLGEQAIPFLRHQLRHGDEIERETAGSLLVLFGEHAQPAIPELTHALAADSPYLRANAAIVLMQFPGERSRAIPIFVKLLQHEDSGVREMAAMNLAVIGDEATPHVDELAAALDSSPEANTLLPVVELLGRIGPPARTAVPRLKQITFEQEGNVRTAAESAIQRIQAEQP